LLIKVTYTELLFLPIALATNDDIKKLAHMAANLKTHKCVIFLKSKNKAVELPTKTLNAYNITESKFASHLRTC
jgi:hypothetical protein